MMTVEVLVSAVDKEPHRLVEEMHIGTDAIIVNQCDRYDTESFWNGAWVLAGILR